MTQEKPGQTLQATALVHEAYLIRYRLQKFTRRKAHGAKDPGTLACS